MKKDCPFCNNKIKSRVVKKGKYSSVILSSPHLAKGHLLVVSLRHIEKISDLKDTEALEIFNFLSKFQKIILKKLSKGTEIRQNFKPYFENSTTHVNHLHFHLIPREKDDNLAKGVDKKRKAEYKSLSKSEEKELREVFKD